MNQKMSDLPDILQQRIHRLMELKKIEHFGSSDPLAVALLVDLLEAIHSQQTYDNKRFWVLLILVGFLILKGYL